VEKSSVAGNVAKGKLPRSTPESHTAEMGNPGYGTR
jgi:hypothetical protein